MNRLPPVGADVLVRVLVSQGFEVVRQRGSHVRLRHRDGRVTVVPVHRGEEIGPGLLRRMLAEVDIDRATFLDLLRSA